MKILCWFGLHKWSGWSDPFLSGDLDMLRLGYPATIVCHQRTCDRCGEKEVRQC